MVTLNPTAADLIARMRKTYASANSYTDRGTATSAIGRLRVTFQTSFVRGAAFRFEYDRGNIRDVVWSDGAHTYTQSSSAPGGWDRGVIDDGADVATAIAAAVGTSSGSAAVVPPMLLPVSIGSVCSMLAGLTDVTSEADESVGSFPCRRIDVRDRAGMLATLWIDRDTYLLRHLVSCRGQANETTTSYEPSLSQIDIQSLAYPQFEEAPQPRVAKWTGMHIALGARRIDAIEQASPAMRSGLVIGDEIEVVNGQVTPRYFDVFKAIRMADMGEQLALTVRRGDERLEVRVPVEPGPRPVRATPSGPLLE